MSFKSYILDDVIDIISNKIDSKNLVLEKYISTENMLPDRGGVGLANSLPTGKVNHYQLEDTLFSNIRTYFKKVWFASFEGGASPDVLVFRTKGLDILDPKFLYYLISDQKFIDYSDQTSKGAKMPRGDKSAILNYKISLPHPSVQKKIAKILSDFDNKIYLNNQTNQTLESISQTIFKSWFIDFEPVKAKIAAKLEGKDPEVAAMCAISGKSEAGLKQMSADNFAELQATAAVFPEIMDSELGQVPREWLKMDLSILADLNVQSWTKNNRPEKIHYVDLSNTKWGVIQKTDEFTFDNAPSRARRVLKIGDTIVGTVRPANGSYAFIQREYLTGSTGFAVLSPKQRIYAEFIYIVATDKENIRRLAHLADGGAYPAVSYDTVLTTPCILPSETESRDRILSLFHKNINELYRLLADKARENQYLADTRDYLLPKLLSGEVDVSELQIEDAVA